MKPSVFRQSSLERLSSPEQLDQLMRVTTPRGWLVFLGLLGLVAAAAVWGFYGSIAVTVGGRGILLRSGGVLPLQTAAGGVVERMLAAPGERVRRGQIVARVSRIDLANRIEETRIRLRELEVKRQQELAYRDRETELQLLYLRQEEAAVVASIRSDREQLEFMEGKARDFEELLTNGGVSRQQLVEAYSQRDNLKQKIAAGENLLQENQRRRIEITRTMLSERSSADSTIDEMRRSLSLLEQQFRLESEVVSPTEGRVIELLANEGAIVEAGSAIVSLEPLESGGERLEAVIYVPSEGSSLQPGTEAQISPAGVRKEEFGFIRGRVTRVADFPSSPQGMMRVLGNENLVGSLVETGPVIEVLVALSTPGRGSDGYEWSSPKGRTIGLRSGTVCTAVLVERKERPIDLIVPLLRRATGIQAGRPWPE